MCLDFCIILDLRFKLPISLVRRRAQRREQIADLPGTCLPVIAAFTAPQPLCPSTKITLVPSTAAPYSRLAMISDVAMFPAIRATKRWPMLWSNTNSTGTRESAQESTAAKGSCLSTVFCFKIVKSSLPGERGHKAESFAP